MEIHLIRHGKTAENEKKLYCGQANPPLSEEGETEVMALRDQGLYPPAPDFCVVSGLIRAGLTLSLIYGAVGRTVIPGLMEYDFGLFELKSHEELENEQEYQAWIQDTSGDVLCPQGESKNMFQARVAEAFDTLLSEATERACHSVAAVIHGGVIASIMESLFPDTRNFYEWQPAYGRGYTLIYENEALQGYQKI